jgi:hypothetical protein
LPRIAELGRGEGLKALDEGRFDTAHQLLSAARRAVDSLGGAFEGADAIRHGAEEAAIFTNLVPRPLEAILEEAARIPTEDWPSHFETLYQGRAIVVDAHFTSVPQAEGSGRYDLDYRIVQEGEGGRPPRIGRIALNGFRLFELAKPKAGDAVRFGARLAGFWFDPSTEEWLVALEPESGVYLTHPEALTALGWPSPNALADDDEEGQP